MGMASKLAAFVGRLTSAGKVPQAALDANVAGNGPAFSANSTTSQAFSAATQTKVLFQNEVFDTNSAYDAATSRFQPNIAGYYQINANCRIGQAGGGEFQVNISKTGSSNIFQGSNLQTSGIAVSVLSALVYLNGTTDYIEIYVFSGNASTTQAGASYVTFSGALVRAA